MTVSSVPSAQELAANGVTVVFPFTFKAIDPADIKVVTVTSDGVESTIAPTAYDVALTNSGGSVTFHVAPISGLTVFIRNNRTYQQTADIKNQVGYRPDQNETAVDSVVVLVKQLLWDLNRCLRLPETEDGSVIALLQSAVARAGAYLGFDGTGKPALIAPGATASPDVVWVFAGQVAADQNENLFIHQVRKFEGFVGFDVAAVVAPTGIPIIIDWEVNGVVIPAYRLTLPVATKYAELLVSVSPALNDKIRPKIIQAGNIEPGRTLAIRMRGL